MTSSYSIYFRPIDPSDRNVVQELHEEWFPIRYHDSFYESIIQNNVYDGYPLYTCVASAIRSNINLDNSSYSEDIESPSCDQGIDESIVKDAWGQHWKSLHIDSLYDLPILFKHSVKPLASNRERASSDRYDERIVGCLIGRFIHNPSEENKSLLLSHSPTYRHTTLFYIMTLGVADDFRNLGLATELIQRCIHLALHVSSCGAIYLHVITYNTGAIQFYEKLGFRRIKEVQDYYNIDGTFYNCYLYAYFIHDRSSPWKTRRIATMCKVFYNFIVRKGRSLMTLSIFQNVFCSKAKS